MMIISELIFEGVEVLDKLNNAFNSGSVTLRTRHCSGRWLKDAKLSSEMEILGCMMRKILLEETVWVP